MKPTPDFKNLWIFYAVFNAFRDTKLGIAFAGGRNDDPAENFKQVTWAMHPSFKDRTISEGFNDRDLHHYFVWLRDNGYIKEYVWVSESNKKKKKIIENNVKKKGWPLNSLLATGNRDMKPKILLININKAIEESSDLHVQRMMNRVIAAFEDYSEQYTGPIWSHGVAAALDEERKCYLYDTAKEIRVESVINDMESYRKSWNCFVRVLHACRPKFRDN